MLCIAGNGKGLNRKFVPGNFVIKSFLIKGVHTVSCSLMNPFTFCKSSCDWNRNVDRISIFSLQEKAVIETDYLPKEEN